MRLDLEINALFSGSQTWVTYEAQDGFSKWEQGICMFHRQIFLRQLFFGPYFEILIKTEVM